MNFQKLFGSLTKSRGDRFFDEIIAHEHIKGLFGLVTRIESLTPNRPTGIIEDNVPYVVAASSEGFVFYRWRKYDKSRNYRLFVQEPRALSSYR
ncbi:MAG: hypothetical protein WCF23_14690 [Candidatus Nitrosopolaris sp.]